MNVKLTQRESDIMNLIIKGKTNQEIANELFISIHTVKANLEKIFNKFSVKNRVQLAVKYILK